MNVQGWGRYPRLQAEVLRPLSSAATVAQVMAEGELIARGMGRSYGDSALAGRVLDVGHLDLLQDFDANSGLLRCDAGVTLDTLLKVFLPRGWFPLVTPGTRFITVGGAIASDVHGKNHHVDGCFSESVESFTLLLGNGSQVTCSRHEQVDLFHATCGGMGLTGVILDARLRMRPVRSSFVEQKTFKAGNLAEAIALFEAHRQATYSVAWIDCLAHGDALGRSLVMVGEHAADGRLWLPDSRELRVPLDMPAFLLNRYSVKAFNHLYYSRVRQQVSQQWETYRAFFYPLDGIAHWNRLYGRNGFVQYQFVIPQEAGLNGMTAIMQRIAESGRGSFLAVLKVLGEANCNPLSFPLRGYTLALDFKVEPGLFPMLDDLDAMVADYGGRLYLAKDARMGEAFFKQGYPQWQAFQEVRARYGALGKFSSLQSRRLGLD